jgi:hypothetical protein
MGKIQRPGHTAGAPPRRAAYRLDGGAGRGRLAPIATADLRASDVARLYTIVSRRHELRSIVVTTNLAFKQWGTIFPGARHPRSLFVQGLRQSIHAPMYRP